MAFKMRGNPFPKKGGAFKQENVSEEIDLAYEKYLSDQDRRFTEVGDSLALVEQPFIDDLAELEKLYQQESISYNKYKEGYDKLMAILEKHKQEKPGLSEEIQTKQFSKYKDIEAGLFAKQKEILAQFNRGEISKDELKQLLGPKLSEGLTFTEVKEE